jgi:hypothetical protein
MPRTQTSIERFTYLGGSLEDVVDDLIYPVNRPWVQECSASLKEIAERIDMFGPMAWDTLENGPARFLPYFELLVPYSKDPMYNKPSDAGDDASDEHGGFDDQPDLAGVDCLSDGYNSSRMPVSDDDLYCDDDDAASAGVRSAFVSMLGGNGLGIWNGLHANTGLVAFPSEPIGAKDDWTHYRFYCMAAFTIQDVKQHKVRNLPVPYVHTWTGMLVCERYLLRQSLIQYNSSSLTHICILPMPLAA